LGSDDLPPDEAVPSATAAGGGPDPMVGRPLADVERYYTERALDLTNNNREEAAKLLGIGERTLYRKLQEWKKEG
jgi:two-component system response regulator HydG